MTLRVVTFFWAGFVALAQPAKAEVGDACPLLTTGGSVFSLSESLKKLVPIKEFVRQSNLCDEDRQVVSADYGSICQLSSGLSLVGIAGIGTKRRELRAMMWRAAYSDRIKNAIVKLYAKEEKKLNPDVLPSGLIEQVESVEIYEADWEKELLLLVKTRSNRLAADFDLVAWMMKKDQMKELLQDLNCIKSK